MDPDQILEGLDPEQRRVAQTVRGPVAVLAGAGTGKTRALTHRIAYAVQTQAMDPRRTLVVTFTTRAAGEFGRRLRAMGIEGVRVRTVHSESLRQLRWMWPKVVGGQPPRLVSSKIALVSTALNRSGVRVDDAQRRDLTAAIERSKASGFAPDTIPPSAVAGLPLGERFPDLYQAYEDAKAAAGAIDFEDLLLLNAGLIGDNLSIAEQVRQWCRWVTVDEYQDVSPLQQRVIEGWLGDRDELCVVGDPSQTIYSFAGARSDYLLGFAERWPGAEILQLTRSYRCTPQIIAVANRVLAQGSARERLTLRSQRSDGPAVATTVYDSDLAEAEGVAGRIRQLIAGGTSPADIAVLVRINAATARFERELQALGIPYSVRGSARFMQRPEVKRAVSLLRVAARQDVGASTLAELATAALEPMGYTPTPPLGESQREEWESLSALIALAESQPEGTTMADLVAELDERAENDDPPVADAVTVASLHTAKGLEWQAVFLVGLYDGGLPLRYQGELSDIDEERRLFYVGVTRAKDVLELSWGEQGSRRERRQPSRFLEGGSQRQAASKPKAARKPSGQTCDACGKRLSTGAERTIGRCRTCPSDIDPGLVEALREWRTQAVADVRASSGKSVPAFLIATDAVLLGIARKRPGSTEELGSVRGIQKKIVAEHGEEILRIVASSG